MTIVRVLVGGCVIAFCAGFIPVGGCAKGCGAAGKVGASHADDFARVGVASRYGDELARGAGRYGDDLAAAGRYKPGYAVGGVAHAGDEAAMLSRASLETRIASLPEAEGAIVSIARRPTPSGVALDGLDDAGRTFGKDYAKSIDDLAVSETQHSKLMDAFETAQELVDPVMELLGDDETDAEDVVASVRAREKLQMVALEFEASLAGVLTPQQLRWFYAQFGSSEVVVYRIGKDKPIKTKTATKAGAPTQRKNDKVAP